MRNFKPTWISGLRFYSGVVPTIFILTVILIPMATGAINPETIDGIAAIVNDKIITCSEIEERLRPYLVYLNQNLEEEERDMRIAEIRRQILNELIKEKLLLLEGKRQGIRISEKEVEKELEIVKKRLGATENFHVILAKQNLTLEKLRMRLKRKVLIGRLVDSQLRGKVEIPSEEEVKTFFEENKKNFVEPEKVAISNITVGVSEETKWLEAKKTMNGIRERVLKGEDFEALAKKYSSGTSASEAGNLGFVNRGELLPEFENVISPLKVGEVSEIIKTNTGLHIIKLNSRKEARQKEFSEVRQEIENRVFHLRMEEALSGWIEELKEKAYIKIIE